MEVRLLKTDGFISNDNKLTQKTLDLLELTDGMFTTKRKTQTKIVLGEEGLANVIVYREMFPAGKLPSGKASRVDVKELEKKFIWFFNTYSYSWDTVFEATRRYIEEYASKGYMYMRNSSFFISKQDNNKVVSSDLATECAEVIDTPEQAEEIIHASQQLR